MKEQDAAHSFENKEQIKIIKKAIEEAFRKGLKYGSSYSNYLQTFYLVSQVIAHDIFVKNTKKMKNKDVDVKQGVELIANERQKQLRKGRSVYFDFKYNNDFQLRNAAQQLLSDEPDILNPPQNWCVDQWKRMCAKSYKERVIIVGALVAAELDRIQMTIDEDNFQQNLTTNYLDRINNKV